MSTLQDLKRKLKIYNKIHLLLQNFTKTSIAKARQRWLDID